MRVEVRPGYWLEKDHPHEIISPHVMRFEEIRDWLRTLSTDERYGWAPKGIRGLERALGMQIGGIPYKLEETGWIYPKEQCRLTARIQDILDGHIVPRFIRTGRAGRPTIHGVLTDPPEPPYVPIPRTIKLRATVNGLERQPPHYVTQPRMPAWRDAFKNVSFWDPDAKRAAQDYGKYGGWEAELSGNGSVQLTAPLKTPPGSVLADARRGSSSKNSARR